MTKEEAWLQVIEKNPHLNNMNDKDIFLYGWDEAVKALQGADDKIPYQSIIATMNAICKRNFKATEAHKKLIRGRWREGMREKDFETVCRVKSDQWQNDIKYSMYLRPETLFGTKMDSYLNEAPKKKKTITNHLGFEVEVDDE